MRRGGRVRIFLSYAHRDNPLFRDELLAILKWRDVAVQPWSDKDIKPGSNWDRTIKNALRESDIFIAMVTTRFAASDYIQKVEAKIAKQGLREGWLKVVPVVVSEPGGKECEWLFKYERLPAKDKSWVLIRQECPDSDEALRHLRDGIRKVVDAVIAEREQAASPSP